ncbi:MAG: type III secretion system export apparatus subunit SctR [Parachlamydiales bacterium]
MRRRYLLSLLLIGLAFLHPTTLAAQEEQVTLPPLIGQMAILVGLSLLPFLVLLLTSFVKMVVVMSLLRSALGVQQAPPNQVINGIALILTLYVMFPTGQQMWQAVEPLVAKQQETQLISAQSAEFIIEAVQAGREPLRQFLIRNTRAKYMTGYFRLAYRYFPADVRGSLTPEDFIVVVPAFITSQVEDAFQIGVLIYLPFFIVDIVTSNILLAMGMMMLSPMTIALPLKLLLLVMMDGWSLLLQGLVMSFKT